jgi:hypothetical protein
MGTAFQVTTNTCFSHEHRQQSFGMEIAAGLTADPIERPDGLTRRGNANRGAWAMRKGLRILLTLLVTIAVVFMFAGALFGPWQMKMDITEAYALVRPIAEKSAQAAAWVETNCAAGTAVPPP